MNEAELLMRPIEVARALGISRSLVYSLIATGRLPVVRLGGRSVRVHRAQLVEILRAEARGPATPDSVPSEAGGR